MAKRGDLARESVKDTIIEAFNKSGNFVAFQDKKIFVQARDGEGGEVIQFAITITMPKVPIAGSSETDWRDEPSAAQSSPVAQPTSLSPADKAKIEELKEKLGLV